MLDLNVTPSSPNHMQLHHRHSLYPPHTFLNPNAESWFPSQIITQAERDALLLHSTNPEISLAPKFMEMISTEHSASSVLTSKTPSDLGLPVDCEASSKHIANQSNDQSVYELEYLNHSKKNCKSGVNHGDYRLLRDDQRVISDEQNSHKVHEISESRQSGDDGKLSWEGESSSVVDGKASVGAAVRAYDWSNEEDDAEGSNGCLTRQLFPSKPCIEDRPISNGLLHHASTIRPIIKANFECLGGLTSVSSNVINTNYPPKPVISASNFPIIRPGAWPFPSSPHIPLPSSMGILNPISPGIQPMKKSRRGPRSRSSQYRGVTFYRRTGRWESHIWDCGKQVYLGGFDTAHAAARAYDRAAIRFRGLSADINFNLADYESEINQMNSISKEEFVHLLRRQSMGFARGSSRFKGMTLHKCGRWEARMGQLVGKKANDEAAIQSNGIREALANFETRLGDKVLIGKKPLSDAYEGDLELSLGTPVGCKRGLQTEEARIPVKTGHESFLGPYNCPSQLYKLSHLGNNTLPQMDAHKLPAKDKTASDDGSSHTFNTGNLISANKASFSTDACSSYKLFTSATDLAAGGWQWQMQQNACPPVAASAFTGPGHTPSPLQAAAASSGFSPQQQGFPLPQWLHKTRLGYISPTSLIHPSH